MIKKKLKKKVLQVKMKNNYRSICQQKVGNKNIAEIASLVSVAAWRLQRKNRAKNLQISLDSKIKWSVNAHVTID